MLNKQTKFILAIALQVVIIFAIIFFKLLILAKGNEVLLRIIPVDPRDMLRGDYVVFQYDISNINSYFANKQTIKNGDTVYVTLDQDGKYWTVQSITKTKPTSGDLFIKGSVDSGGFNDQAKPSLAKQVSGSRLHVIYGIEQYFIPEGKGQNFSFLNKEAAARVMIDDNGNSMLKQIYVDGKLWP